MSYQWRDGRQRSSLPIDTKLDEILDLIGNNQVVVVQAETGAGKTTRISQALVDDSPDLDVYMTLPRRAPVRWNGKRIAEEMGDTPGGVVGWRLAREEPKVSDDTRLTLMVDQTLSNRIRQRGRLPKGVLVIDEAHERSVSTDVLLGLIKQYLPNSPETRVVITSATIDTKKFSEFFGDAPVIDIPGRCFPVSTEVTRLGLGEHHSQGATRAAIEVMNKYIQNSLSVPTADGNGEQEVGTGTVLILLPGKEDIENVRQSITREAGRLKIDNQVEIVGCHGESSPQEQDSIHLPLAKGKLRFVCGTEILRSSVTVSGTIGVIDSLQIKRLITDKNGVAHLTKIAVSKAESEQARGRAGRTNSGFYIPVSFNNEFETLQQYPTPAILREPLERVALQIAAIGQNARTFDFIDAPDPVKIDKAIQRLKWIGALNDDEKITDEGESLLRFPLDPERAKALIKADHYGVLPEAVVATAVLEAEGIFFHPKRSEEPFMVDEELLKLILANTSDNGYGTWRENNEFTQPNDNARIPSNLPKWVTPKGNNLYQVSTEYEKGFAGSDKRRWVSGLIRRYWAGPEQSDFTAIVEAYRAFIAEERRLRDIREQDRRFSSRNVEQALRDWCERWCINYKRLCMAEDIMHEIRSELANSPLKLENGLSIRKDFSTEALTKSLASGLIDNVAKSNGYRYLGPIGEFELSRQSGQSNGGGSSSLVLVDGVKAIHLSGGRGGDKYIHIAEMAAPLKPEWLEEISPDMCSRSRDGEGHYDSYRDEVLEGEITRYLDLVVGHAYVMMQNDDRARTVFVSWLRSKIAQSNFYDFHQGDEKGVLLKEIFRHNYEIVEETKRLNVRAGSKVFHEMSYQNESDFIMEKIGGARRLADISDLNVLRLPAIDQDLKEQVLRDNPEEISILSHDFEVQYNTSSGIPAILIRDTADDGEHRIWQDLPDSGVYLPGGRQVCVTIFIGKNDYTGVRNTDIAELKREVEKKINELAWREAEKPDSQLLDLKNETEGLPEIELAVIGHGPIDHQPLIAYGAYTPNSVRPDGTILNLGIVWFANEDEAREQRQNTIAAINRSRNEERERAELAETCSQLENAKRELGEFISKYFYGDEKLLSNESHWKSLGLIQESVYVDGLAQTKERLRQIQTQLAVVQAEVKQERARREDEEKKKNEAEIRAKEEFKVIFAKVPHYSIEEAKMAADFAKGCLQLLGGDKEKLLDIFERVLDSNAGFGGRRQMLATQIPRLGHDSLTACVFEAIGRARDFDDLLEAAFEWVDSGEFLKEDKELQRETTQPEQETLKPRAGLTPQPQEPPQPKLSEDELGSALNDLAGRFNKGR